MPKQQVPITAKALLQRINRKLRWSGRTLKRTRGGGYYVLDVERNFVARQHVSLEDFGRELGVLQPFEILSAGHCADVKRLRDSGITLRAIGQQFGVSRQRIHQILKQTRVTARAAR